MTTHETFQSLVKSNELAAAAHLISALTVIALYLVWKNTHPYLSAEVFRNTIAGPETPDTCNTNPVDGEPNQCNVNVGLTKPVYMFKVNIIFGAVAFFVITAFAHAFYASDGFGSKAYSSVLAQGWNPYRWFEYATTASIMTLITGLVDGIRDMQTILILTAITAAMQFCGFSVESLLRGQGKLSLMARDSVMSSTAVGWLLYLTLWTSILVAFAYAVHDVNTKYEGTFESDGVTPIKVPTWVWFIIISQAVYYALFGFVQLNHIRGRFSGKAFDYLKTEKAYIGLSFFAKISLAAGLSYGLLFRTKDCPAV